MNIKFERKDPVYIDVEDLCEKIAQIISGHPDLLEFVCSLLMSIQESTNTISKEVTEFFEICKCDVLDEDMKAYVLLENIFVDYYNLIQDFDFDSKLRQYNGNEYKNFRLYDNVNKMKLFRGVVFEHIISSFVSPRYLGQLYETGSMIIIDGHQILFNYGEGNSKRKMTVDIAAWDDKNDNGEFYEYMMKLSRAIRKDRRQVITALVTADAQENAESKILELRKDDEADENITCIGKEHLAELKTFAFTLSA